MSGYFKDTGEMVGDIRGGFRAGAPIAAAAGMVGITIFIQLAKTAFLSWRAMLFWKVLTCALLAFVPIHIGLFYGMPFVPDPKLGLVDWFFAEIIIWINLLISFYYYGKRYRMIENEFGLDEDKVDFLHTKIVTHALIHAFAIFITFLIIYLFIEWILSFFTAFKPNAKTLNGDGGWFVLGSKMSGMVIWGWFLFCLFIVWGYCITNFKQFATEFIQNLEVNAENVTSEQIQFHKNECIKNLEWSYKGIRKVMFGQLKLLLILIVLFLLFALGSKFGIISIGRW